MFVRAKTIKGQRYAYLVENKWRRGRAKQKVKKYLGKIIEIFPIEVLPMEFEGKTSRDLIRHLLTSFLLSCGFTQKSKNRFVLKKILIDLGRFKVLEGEKDVVLFCQEGYLYGRTLRELFKLQHDPIALRPGLNIAEAFTSAGIKISSTYFIKLYKMFEEEYEAD